MSESKKNWTNIIKSSKEAKLCKNTFIESSKDASTVGLFERLRWRKVLFAVIVLYLSICFMKGCYTIVDLKTQENHLTISRIEASRKYKSMTKEVKWMKTDEAVETIAREELGMVQPGEILVSQKETLN